MKNIIISFILGLIVGAIGIYFLKKPEIIRTKIPISMEVPVPVIENNFNKVFFPVFKKSKLDTNYYNKYKELKKDSIKLDSLVKELITIRSYDEMVEDDTITINLNATVRGDLLDYQIKYKTKPYTIPLDTTIYINIPQKPEFYFGGILDSDIVPSSNKLGFSPTGAYINKKHNKMFLGGYDIINKRVKAGILIKF